MSTMHMLTHTHAHTADPYNSLIKWKPWYPFLHPRVNEYQWETDMTVLGMCVCMCVCAHSCVHACDWMIDKEKRKMVPYSQVLFWTGYVAVWDFFSIIFLFFILPHSFVSMTSGSLLFPVHRSLIKPSNEEVMHNFICSSSTWGHFLTSLKSMIVSFWKAITLFQ